MDITCSATPCPVILDASCVFYSGSNLIYTGIVTNDNLCTALEKIDAKFQDAAIGYIFQNGIVQAVPGGAVKLGGSLIENTIITSNGFTFALTGTIESSAFITTGGTSSQFVKGDGSLDGTSYQPTGNYITALTGDGTASGPGSATFTLTNVNANNGTFGSDVKVPIITADNKGRITSITETAINFPDGALTFLGDVTGTGFTGNPVTLTLATVNANTYGTDTLLKFSVNGKGLVTSASPVIANDIENALGYVPVPNTRTLTINGQSYDLSADRTWTISAGTVTSVGVTAGTGISASVSNPTTTPNITITNTAPDQTVVLNSGSGINVTGTYPNFTITNTGLTSVPTLQQVTTAGNSSTNSLNIHATIVGNQIIGIRDASETYTARLNNVVSVLTSNRDYYLPNNSGYLTLSVNGNTADSTGNITVSTGGIGGGGTLNYVPKWTPDGSTLGDSLIYDDGNVVKTQYSGFTNGLELDFTNKLYSFGNDIGAGGIGLRIDDTNKVIGTTYNTYPSATPNYQGLYLDMGAGYYGLFNNEISKIGYDINALGVANIGDISGGNLNSTRLTVDAQTDVISTYSLANSIGDVGLKLDFSNNQYTIGDWWNNNNILFNSSNGAFNVQYGGFSVIDANAQNFGIAIGDANSGGNNTYIQVNDSTQQVLVSTLSGTGTRMVVADSSGILGTQTIPTFISPLTTKGDIYVRNASADTRLPVGLDTQILIADSTTATGLKWGSNTTPPASGYYGAFQDNVTQTAAVSNTGYAMIFRTTDLSNGVTVVTNGTSLTRITFANTGIYNLQFSSQFQNTSNQLADVTIWLRLNGSDVAGSSGFASIPNSHGGTPGHSIVSWNYLLSVVAGQYYELVWSTSDATNVTMQYYAAGSPPPSTASVILTVTQQSGIMAGTGITAINSLTGAAQTLSTGTTGTDFAISSSGTTHTFNLPDASATARGVITTGTQTLAGVKTFNNSIKIPNLTGSPLVGSIATDGTLSGLSTATYPSLTELSYVKGVTSAIQTQLNGKQATLTNPVTGTGTSGSLTKFSGTTTVQNATADVDYLQQDMSMVAYQAMGSSIKGYTICAPSIYNSTAGSFTNQQLYLIAVYIPKAVTLTGVRWYQYTNGNYTASNYNGVGLFSGNSGSSTITLVASSTNDGNCWQQGAGWQSKAFSSTYAASAGLYYIGLLYSSSAATTIPQSVVATGTAAASAALASFDFTNGHKLNGAISSQTSMPSSTTISSASANSTRMVAYVY